MLSYNDDPKLVEEKVMQTYNLLKELSAIEDFPAISFNSRRALGVMWQVTSDLDLEFEQLFHLKV